MKKNIRNTFIYLLFLQSTILSMPIPQPVPMPAPAIAPTTIPQPIMPSNLMPEQAPVMPAQLPMIAQPVTPILPAPLPQPSMVIPEPAPVPVATPMPIPQQVMLPAPAALGQPAFAVPVVQPQLTPLAIQQQLSKVSDDINSINTLKSSLKNQLLDLDNKLAQGQEQLMTIKKTSFDILSKGDETQAQQALDSMKQTLTSIQLLQKTINSVVVQEFNMTVQKIRDLMTSVQLQLQSLENASIALKAGTTPQSPAMPVSSEKPVIRRSVIHRIFNTAADAIVGTIAIVTSIISSMKEMIIPSQPSLHDLEQQQDGVKKKALADQQPAIMNTAIPQQPLPTPIAPLITPIPTPAPSFQLPLPSQPTLADQIKVNIAAIEETVKQLDEQRFQIQQVAGDITKQSKALREQIKTNKDLQKITLLDEEKPSTWKKGAEDWFMKFLNGIDIAITKAHKGFSKLYNTTKQGVTKGLQAVENESPLDQKTSR